MDKKRKKPKKRKKIEVGVIKRGGVLMPLDQWQAEEINKIPEGTSLAIEYEIDRSLPNHCRFFAFLNTAVNMQEHYTTVNQLRFALLIKSGYCEKVISHKSGSVTFVPESMSFDSMGEVKFREVFKNCIDSFHIMLEEMGIHITDNQLYLLMGFE